MDAMHKLKILVMLLALAVFVAVVILNAGDATGTFKGNANKLALFRGGFHALHHLMTYSALGGLDLFVTTLLLQIHLYL